MTRHGFIPWLMRRWWFWVVLPVALSVAAAMALRLAGEVAWYREGSAARVAGFPASGTALLAAAPPVDEQRQERLWRLGLRWWQDEDRRRYPKMRSETPLYDLWEMRDTTRLAHITPRWAAECAANLAELSAILDDGPLLWGRAGWMRQDGADPEALVNGGRRDPLPILIAAWEYACLACVPRIFSVDASVIPSASPDGPGMATTVDPVALGRLDQLRHAMRPVWGMWDAT